MNLSRDNFTVQERLFDRMDDLLQLDVAIPEMADVLTEVSVLCHLCVQLLYLAYTSMHNTYITALTLNTQPSCTRIQLNSSIKLGSRKSLYNNIGLQQKPL